MSGNSKQPAIMALPTPQGAPAGSYWWKVGEVTVAVDPPAVTGGRWHLSLAHPERRPTWTEVLFVRRHLLPPDVHVVSCVPMQEKNPHAVHLWQLADPWLNKQFAFEANLLKQPKILTP